ncbi:MAG: hypothetical protein H6830_09925 [Planctomycetes bacterium]|nr:hypothetical protein [Planctomycetota bacterium]
MFRRYVPGKGSPLWHPEAAESRYTQVPVGPRTLPTTEETLKPAFLLQGPGPKSLSIRDQFDPVQFNRVEVEATVFETGPEHLTVEIVRVGEVLLTSPTLALEPNDRAPTTLVFEFPALNTWQTPFDEIRIRMGGPAILTTVSLVSLWHSDLQDCLPEAEEPLEARYVTWGGETRRGYVVGPDVPLHMSSGQNLTHLRLAYAPVPGFHNPRLHAKLRLSGTQRSQRSAQDWELLGLTQTTASWHELDLQPSAVRTVRESDWDFFPDSQTPSFVMLADTAIFPAPGPADCVLLVTSEGMDWPIGSPAKITDLPVSIRPWLEDGLQYNAAMPSSMGRTPQLVALMTGKGGRDTGVFRESDKLALAADTLAERFRRAGYRTLASVYSESLRHDATGLGQGFDRFGSPPTGSWSTAQTVRNLKGWVQESEGCPLFLWLHLPGSLSGDPAGPPWGTELESLVAMPALQNAVMAFTATVRQETGPKTAVVGSRRVPLVLRQKGLHVEVPAEPRIACRNLGRTLLAMCGLPAEDFPGLDLAQGPFESWNQAPQFTLGPDASTLALQGGPWLMVVHTGATPGDDLPRHYSELYRIDSDPECLNNLAQVNRAQTRRLRLALARWVAEREDLGWSDPKRLHQGNRAWIRPQAFAGNKRPQDTWLPEHCSCPQCPPDLQGE